MGFFSNLFAKTPESLLLGAAKAGRLEKVISALTAGATLEATDKVRLDLHTERIATNSSVRIFRFISVAILCNIY